MERRLGEDSGGKPPSQETICDGQTGADLASGAATALQCIADSQLISVATPQGTFAIVNGAAMPPFCNVNLVPPFVELTQPEVVACRDLLLKAAASQGVDCVPPE